MQYQSGWNYQITPAFRTVSTPVKYTMAPPFFVSSSRATMPHLLPFKGKEADLWYTTAFSSVGTVAVQAMRDGDQQDILLRDWQTGKVVKMLPAATGPVNRLALSKDGLWVAAIDVDGRVDLWNVEDGYTRILENGGGCASAIAFSPNNRELMVGYTDGTFATVDYRYRSVNPHSIHEVASISTLVFSPDGTRLTAGCNSLSNSGSIVTIDPQSGNVISTQNDTAPVLSVAYTPDGNTFAASGAAVRVWVDNSLAPKTSLTKGPFLRGQIAFSPDGATLACNTNSNDIYLFNAEDGNVKSILRSHRRGNWSIMTIAFSPDGQFLLVGNIKTGIEVFDIQTGKRVNDWGI